MEETKLFTIRLLIALFIGLLIAVPVGILKAKRYIKEGRSIKNLPIKIATTIVLPILSIPFLLSKSLTWAEKLIAIILMGAVGTLWVIGVDSAQRALRKLLGLPPIDEDTGQVIKEKDDQGKNDNKD